MKRWTIAILTLVFVGFYAIGVYGVWNGDSAGNNNKVITLLQPIVYVIIGYYFGRMPSEKVEKQLKDEAKEKGHQADDAIAAANQARTKMQAVKTLLAGVAGPANEPRKSGFTSNLSGSNAGSEDTLRITVAHAINVIDQSP